MTWVFDVVSISPRLLITSPRRRCGKTRLLEILAALVHRSLASSSITAAGMFRAIEEWQPTLLIDEADTFVNGNEELRGIINSGHTRGMANVVRVEDTAGKRKIKSFSTWAPMAIAGIGKQADTILDRSIIIELKRKLTSDKVSKLRHRDSEALRPLAQKLARWAMDNQALVGASRPEIPNLNNDRAEDNWEPLLQIAETIGADTASQARRAARALTKNDIDADDAASLLLEDIMTVFDAREGADADRVSSAELVEALIEDTFSDRPWATWSRGNPITQPGLAKLLRDFSVQPSTVRLSTGKTPRGYQRAWFEDAWRRYLQKDSPLSPELTATVPQLAEN